MADIILGKLATNSFNDSDRRPKDWRESIAYLYPNGAPLTAMTALMSKEKTTDPQFYWWTKKLMDQVASVTGVYTDTGLSTAYNPANSGALAAAASSLHFKMTEADSQKIRVGHQVLMRDAGVIGVFNGSGLTGKVTASVQNGASSYITVKLLQADVAVTSGGALGTFDHGYLEFSTSSPASAGKLVVIGSINEEGATSPTEVMYEPVKFYNYTQIFRTPLSMTRTVMKTKLRTGPQVAQAKKEALEIHAMELEKNLIFSVASEGTGANGKPERTTDGIIAKLGTDQKKLFSGTWLGSSGTGWSWLQTALKDIFTYGSQSRIAFCGPDAILNLNLLAQDIGQLNITAKDTAIGMKFMQIDSPFGTLYLKQHPLFSAAAGLNKTMLIVEPDNLKYRFIDDTQYLADIGANDMDGEKSEYLTECGLELYHPETFMLLANIGG